MIRKCLSRVLLILATGGMLLQTTTSCQNQLVSVATEAATSILLNAVLGSLTAGLAT